LNPKVGRKSEENHIQFTQIQDHTEASRDQTKLWTKRPKSLVLPRKHGNLVEARVDFCRVASSCLLEPPSAYKYPCRDMRWEQIEL